MKRLCCALAVLGLLVGGCMKEAPTPPTGDLDSIESTLNSVESELTDQ
jgi:hypothetical protein